MNELTREDMKANRKKAKVINRAESPEMRKRMDAARKIEKIKDEPCITDREYFDELYDSL